MSEGVLVLGPVLAKIGSTLGVKFGVIFEDSGLGDVSLVVGVLLALFVLSELGVLLGGEASRNVRFRCDLTNLQL